MLYSLLQRHAQAAPHSAAVIAPEQPTDWAGLLDLAKEARETLAPARGQRVGVRMPAGACWLAALAALDELAADVVLLDELLGDEATQELAQRLNLTGIVESKEEAAIGWRPLEDAVAEGSDGSVTILTSGTTGIPKAARHTWQGLSRPVRGRSQATQQLENVGGRWLLTYRPRLYAGLQVVLQCLVTRGTLVVPSAHATPAELTELLVAAGVTHISATPSWWRRMLLLAPRTKLAQAPLVQITLGGEAVDQPLLTALAETYPQARLTHIYATTELGRCFSVTDGQEGFPARFLEAVSPDGVEMKIDDGELCVRSANAMLSYDRRGDLPEENAAADPREHWFRTGDLVELRDDRVYFVGRRSEMINVGGNKVQPLEVERVLRQVPGVADVRVYGQRSSIAGQLVACEIVPAEGVDVAELRKRVLETGQLELAAHQRPRLVNFVETIQLTSAGKTARQEKAGEGT